MANIFQKIFLPKKKLAEINQVQEILRQISKNPTIHRAYTTKTGSVVRRFTTVGCGYNIHAERTVDPTRPTDKQIVYSLSYVLSAPIRVKYATNSDVDKVAEKIYTKMYKIWESKNQNAR